MRLKFKLKTWPNRNRNDPSKLHNKFSCTANTAFVPWTKSHKTMIRLIAAICIRYTSRKTLAKWESEQENKCAWRLPIQLHLIDIQIGDFVAIFVIYALITSLMCIKSFDLFTHSVQCACNLVSIAWNKTKQKFSNQRITTERKWGRFVLRTDDAFLTISLCAFFFIFYWIYFYFQFKMHSLYLFVSTV